MQGNKSGKHFRFFKNVKDFWSLHFLGAEFSLAVSFTIAFGLWCKFAGGSRIVTRLVGAQHSVVYGTFVTLDGALLGFMIAATAIILGFAPSDKFNLLRVSPHYPTMWRTLKSTIRVLGLATLIAIIALLVDRDKDPNLFLLVVWVGTTLLAGFRVSRSLWVLEKTIDILTDQKNTS